jgi:nicotinate-nucleotide pyrophosphorylase (carboxylating)
MLKENHIIAAGSSKNAVQLAQIKYPNLPLIVEVEYLTQLTETLELPGINRVQFEYYCQAIEKPFVHIQSHTQLPILWQ